MTFLLHVNSSRHSMVTKNKAVLVCNKQHKDWQEFIKYNKTQLQNRFFKTIIW